MKRERISSTSHISKERRKKSFVKLFWFLVFLIVLFFGLAFLSHIDSFLIDDFSVSGNEVLEKDELKDKTFEILNKKVLLFYAGENKFLFSKNNLTKSLKKHFPRILDISVTREDKKLFLEINERERSYLWCGEHPPLYENRSLEKNCFFLDDSGFVFDTAPRFSSGVYFTFYSKIKDETDPIGQYILEFSFLKDITSLIKAVEEKGLPINSLVAKDDGQYEILFNIETTYKDYPKLLFTSSQSINEVYNKFISIVDEDPFKSDFLSKKHKLEYIDTRFNNRVFYRFSD